MNAITEPSPALKPSKPAKRRKKLAKARIAKADAPADAAAELGGLTATECCFDCSGEGCVISGANYCGHPAKGGAQPAMQRDPEAMKRYHAARKKLSHQAAEKRA